MMSFLRSILFRNDDKIKHLEQELEEVNERILSLEEAMERMSQAVSSLGICVTAVAATTQELSLDITLMTTAVKAAFRHDSDELFNWNVKGDDDGFIN